jgi:uncharacterized membrane protein
VQASLRKVLIDSHVAAVVVAFLIFYSLSFAIKAFSALWRPAFTAFMFLITAVAIRGIPYIHRTLDPLTRLNLLIALSNLLIALAMWAAAWLLSRWVYGTGLLRTLSSYRSKLSRKTHA